MDWGVSQSSMFPLQWVADGLCPFINTHLYGSSLPPALKDAYAVCAAYAMKNHLNSSLVLGIVESKADSLLYDPEQRTWTPQQQLAAVQSLVMYQLIRWFDGDIRQRALADQAEAACWRELDRLFDRNQEGSLLVVSPPPEPGDTGLGGGGRVSPGMTGGEDMTGSGFEYANSETVAAWRQFLFTESCRRTVIFAYTMRGIYAMAKQGYCHLGNRVAQMSFTSSSRI
ncbi:hypothetical protein SUNI508_03255 [Seiridium unicorne]|uniref:Uncharacterized protein n=1 Tax=Seiridium unicorne TaxID=138068 RepID=A0ABR2VF91_9PEZI